MEHVKLQTTLDVRNLSSALLTMKINTLQIIQEVFLLGQHPVFYPPNAREDEIDKDTLEMKEKMKEARNFLLDVKKAQFEYDSMDEFNILESKFKDFMPPFDNCLFAFQEPLEIKWLNQEANQYRDHKLMGILLYKTIESTASVFHPGDSETYGFITPYKMQLIFEEEGLGTDLTVPEGAELVVGRQSATFCVITSFDKDNLGILQVDHYPCADKLTCSIKKNGLSSKTGRPCQEVLARHALVKTLIYIVNKIHDVYVVERKRDFRDDSENKTFNFIPMLPFGWPFAKGNLPKDNYTLKLDGVRYKYDSADIDTGSGTKHRYRYDVRRHPRIVEGRIVWVSSYQRGSGKYISKIYSNSKTWLVPYVWLHIEKLSKIRILEILLVKLIMLFKDRRRR